MGLLADLYDNVAGGLDVACDKFVEYARPAVKKVRSWLPDSSVATTAITHAGTAAGITGIVMLFDSAAVLSEASTWLLWSGTIILSSAVGGLKASKGAVARTFIHVAAFASVVFAGPVFLEGFDAIALVEAFGWGITVGGAVALLQRAVLPPSPNNRRRKDYRTLKGYVSSGTVVQDGLRGSMILLPLSMLIWMQNIATSFTPAADQFIMLGLLGGSTLVSAVASYPMKRIANTFGQITAMGWQFARLGFVVGEIALIANFSLSTDAVRSGLGVTQSILAVVIPTVVMGGAGLLIGKGRLDKSAEAVNKHRLDRTTTFAILSKLSANAPSRLIGMVALSEKGISMIALVKTLVWWQNMRNVEIQQEQTHPDFTQSAAQAWAMNVFAQWVVLSMALPVVSSIEQSYEKEVHPVTAVGDAVRGGWRADALLLTTEASGYSELVGGETVSVARSESSAPAGSLRYRGRGSSPP